jgi:hypothetical protein
MNTISIRHNYSAYTGDILPGSNASSFSNKTSDSSFGVKQGIAIAGMMEIDRSQLKSDIFTDIPDLKLPTPDSPQEYQSRLYEQGNVRQTGLIKENGKIVGTISDKGITTFSSTLGREIHNAGLNANSSLETIQSFLSSQYDGKITIEKFFPGQGPSYAEVHNKVYNVSYDSLVKRQVEEYAKESFSNFIDTTA